MNLAGDRYRGSIVACLHHLAICSRSTRRRITMIFGASILTSDTWSSPFAAKNYKGRGFRKHVIKLKR